MNVVDQLVRIYFEEEYWHKEKLSEKGAIFYHETMLQKGRILVCLDGPRVCGYVESWRLNFEQLGRIVCDVPFSATLENVETGLIAYLANVFISKESRNSAVYKYLRSEFFKQNYACEFYIGHARRKKTEPLKVFRRQDVFKKWIQEKESEKEVILNGR